MSFFAFFFSATVWLLSTCLFVFLIFFKLVCELFFYKGDALNTKKILIISGMRAPGSAPNVLTKLTLTTMAEMTTKTASAAKATTTVIVHDGGKKDELAGGAIGGIVLSFTSV